MKIAWYKHEQLQLEIEPFQEKSVSLCISTLAAKQNIRHKDRFHWILHYLDSSHWLIFEKHDPISLDNNLFLVITSNVFARVRNFESICTPVFFKVFMHTLILISNESLNLSTCVYLMVHVYDYQFKTIHV